MAQITITIPDAVLTRVLNAFASSFGYNSATDGTKAAFAKAQILKWAKQVVVNSEANAAASSAAQTAAQTATTDIALT